jgi:pilus assembly protein CpaC
MILGMGGVAQAAQPAPLVQLVSGKSSVVMVASDALRVSVGNPEVGDVMLLNPREIYLLGKKPGSTNLMVWTKDGNTTVMDVSVTLDVQNLRSQLRQLMPSEKNLVVEVLGETVVLGGVVSDPIKLQRLVSLAEALTDGKKIINLMRVEGSQQIMLEVKVAEISRTLLNQLSVGINGAGSAGSTSFGMVSSLLGTGAGTISTTNGDSTVSLNAEIKKGLIKILAEPTITAISGQEGSFLAGGKIFIPVPQSSSNGTRRRYRTNSITIRRHSKETKRRKKGYPRTYHWMGCIWKGPKETF